MAGVYRGRNSRVCEPSNFAKIKAWDETVEREAMDGTVIQVNVKGRQAGQRGIPKKPVERAEIRGTGLIGDFNRYRQEKLRGDSDSAVLLLPMEVIEELRLEGWEVQPGDLGENVTTEGIVLEAIGPGTRLIVGGQVELELSRVCKPCQNLRVLPYIGGERLRDFMQTLEGRRGWYARVIREGMVRPGDSISVTAPFSLNL